MDGSDGADGAAGPAGAAGATGAAGADGDDGADGEDGEDGAAGLLFVAATADVAYQSAGAQINIDGPGTANAAAGQMVTFQYRNGSDFTASTALTVSYNGSATNPVIIKDGANRQMRLNDFARYDYFIIQKAAPNWILVGGSQHVPATGDIANDTTGGGEIITKLWAGTDAQYQALTPADDTLYFVDEAA